MTLRRRQTKKNSMAIKKDNLETRKLQLEGHRPEQLPVQLRDGPLLPLALV